MNVLEINELKKSFGDKEVLKGLSLSVNEGSIFGFIGKNGAGKTTAMKIALGLLSADSGSINVMGEQVNFGQTATNRHIGYLPDVPEFYSFMTAREYLAFCGNISGMSKKEIDFRAEELLELVGLKNEKHRIRGYSRGMKQRLGIAQALFNKPKLLLCDEPTSALDPIGRKEILDLLLSIKDQTTVLFSTHILSDIERICTDIAFINNGVICLDGKLDEIKSKFRKEEYLILCDRREDVEKLLSRFGNLMKEDKNKLCFKGGENEFYSLLSYVADNRLSVSKIEKTEPDLEGMFMEVISK